MKHRQEQKEGNWKKKTDPYKIWVDNLPNMDKEEARAGAYGYWKCVIAGIGFWATIIYAIQQGTQFYCINQCMKAQKLLEDKYMGPEVGAVQPTERQVAAVITVPQ